MEVNYNRVNFYDFTRDVKPPNRFLVWLQYVLSRLTMPNVPFTYEKIGIEGLKPPFILLSNHMQFVDFKLTAQITYPLPLCNIVAIDGYTHRAFLLRAIGSIPKRKFVTELNTLRSIRRVLDKGAVLSLYPEARYTPIGTLAPLPESLGVMCRRMKVPVVIIKHHGNHLQKPFWDQHRPRRVPLHSVMKLILTPEQIASMSSEEVNEALRREMYYDEYRYWQESGFRITEPYRAEGLHKVLYRCPACNTDFSMRSSGAELYCKSCGKRWELGETGFLAAKEGETEFNHVPDWFEWQRGCVREEILAGDYFFEDDIELYSLPGVDRYHYLGRGRLRHDLNGFLITGYHNGAPIRIERKPLSIHGLHVEYDYFRVLKGRDAIDISTENDSFFCFPERQLMLTKLSFATEEMYSLARQNVRRNLRGRRTKDAAQA
ncbi:MAG: hypothetical protein GX628_03775 [Clostridiales bacterium]|nr:hypothetical protein [Clostridiales bacterium]